MPFPHIIHPFQTFAFLAILADLFTYLLTQSLKCIYLALEKKSDVISFVEMACHFLQTNSLPSEPPGKPK